MKIVQTFWSGGRDISQTLRNSGGWLSPEFHWLSWALSCLQLTKHYQQVELVTDTVGKHILIDLLKLPYSSVRVELDSLNHYSPKLWALAKIYTYKLQKEPFLHVDGDIYIWEPFDEHFLKAELIAQNLEIDFPYYKEPLTSITSLFSHVPSCISQEFSADQSIHSCNTGLIGGSNLAFFRRYVDLAFTMIDENIAIVNHLPLDHFNICFEQFLYYALSKESATDLTYYISSQQPFDPTYPGFANFDEVPFNTKFIHAMYDYKRHSNTCWHLSNRVRQDYPAYYYTILATCQRNTIALFTPVYHLPELSPKNYEYTYFLDLENNVEARTNSAELEPVNWVYHYVKYARIYREAQTLLELEESVLLQQQLSLDKDCRIIEEYLPELNQWVEFADLRVAKTKRLKLETLKMILLDSFMANLCIGEAIAESATYLTDKDLQNYRSAFKHLALNHIKELLFEGILRWTRPIC